MSLLPSQIIPETNPIGTVNEKGDVIVNHNWWLLLYNICQQVLANGSGATTAEIASLGFFKAAGPDYERQIGNLARLVACLPNPAGRIATLERRIADIELLVYSKVT